MAMELTDIKEILSDLKEFEGKKKPEVWRFTCPKCSKSFLTFYLNKMNIEELICLNCLATYQLNWNLRKIIDADYKPLPKGNFTKLKI